MPKISMKTRKARLIKYMYNRICEGINNGSLELGDWIDELDALGDVQGVEFEGGKDSGWDWTINKECELEFY
jgi:hypothetical protein